jgi:hypothetical protein
MRWIITSEQRVTMSQSESDERILQQLSTGEADPILVADFQPMSMAPRLSGMLSELIRGQAVFQVDPIRALSGKRLYASLPELAAACADEFLGSGADPGHVFVVGHCSAAPLSLRVADLLVPTRSVSVVLLNPSWPDDEMVTVMFDEFLDKFATGTRPCPDLDADASTVVLAMEQVFRDEMTALAASRGLTDSMGAFSDLLLWYRGWLAFLLAGRNDAPVEMTTGQAEVTVLSDSPSTRTVEGLSKNAYRVCELPQPTDTVTVEVAKIVATYISRR